MKHLLSIQSLTTAEIQEILRLAKKMKNGRSSGISKDRLTGQCWGLIFAKSSTRTRVSFEVGIRELGGAPMFFSAADLQLGRGEPIKDTARVLGRMISGAIIRTFEQNDVEEFAKYSGIPTINALTDEEHPCQILADLQTIEEKLGSVAGKRICFLGDGDCNVARSWIWAAARCGFLLMIGAPKGFQPPAELIEAAGSCVEVFEDPADAAHGADVLYTDVWVSMGREAESAQRLDLLSPYQLNNRLLDLAASNALVMHCLPAYRGKEITEEVFEEHASLIFTQAENRLHAQKAVLELLTIQ
jgi:ornithine carbamoyltransferase